MTIDLDGEEVILQSEDEDPADREAMVDPAMKGYINPDSSVREDVDAVASTWEKK